MPLQFPLPVLPSASTRVQLHFLLHFQPRSNLPLFLKLKRTLFSSSPSFIFVSIFSLSIFLNSVVSIFDAFSSKDRVGTVLQLQVLSLALLFLLYSALGLLNNKKGDGLRYKPLGAEIQLMDSNGGNFTLDSDDDLDSGIKEEDGLVKEKSAVVELGGNGHASHV
ncbi:uncharacterized protein [Gossypium hirsutum]|uniref:Uncharacterized protein n=1 Tax=Gossypium hirsutum TaxID=3635 RepID=A0ABM3C2A8_GOSHI|nr:uncharacterized protein LOC107941251 [Gossypium hirsutum]